MNVALMLRFFKRRKLALISAILFVSLFSFSSFSEVKVSIRNCNGGKEATVTWDEKQTFKRNSPLAFKKEEIERFIREQVTAENLLILLGDDQRVTDGKQREYEFSKIEIDFINCKGNLCVSRDVNIYPADVGGVLSEVKTLLTQKVKVQFNWELKRNPKGVLVNFSLFDQDDHAKKLGDFELSFALNSDEKYLVQTYTLDDGLKLKIESTALSAINFIPFLNRLLGSIATNNVQMEFDGLLNQLATVLSTW